MKTIVKVDGANCPHCFTLVLDRLLQTEGVHDVHGSLTGPSIEIFHDNVDVERLVGLIRDGLHGVEYFSSEIQMMPLELNVASDTSD